MKQVYNIMHEIRKKGMEGRTVVQQFFYECNEKGYFMEHRFNTETNKITDIFFASPYQLSILKAFPYIVWLDSTYATNSYDLPFLEIVGITYVWKNYNIVGAFLEHEDEESYKWSIEQLSKMFVKVQQAPTCLVTDREKALMNALEKQFPEAKFLLYRRHVRKNIEDFGKKAMDKFRGTTFSNEYMKLFKETTIEGYEATLKKIQQDWTKYPKCLQYVQKNWLDPYMERIVSVWTDTLFTLGTTTTNKVEGAHSSLKSFFTSNDDNLCTTFDQYDARLRTHISEIREDLNESIEKRFTLITNTHIFCKLYYKVSAIALARLIEEYKKGEGDPLWNTICRCQTRVRDGLPCVHDMARNVMNQEPIKPSSLHPFWRQFTLSEVRIKEEEEATIT